MKLIEINPDHYVIVDDSEIKEDCYALHESPLGEREIVTANGQCKLDRRITHSTQPIEKLNESLGWKEIEILPLSEVKELISLSEVKEIIGQKVNVIKRKDEYLQKVKEGVKDFPQDDRIHILVSSDLAFTEGYNQALEDNKDRKYSDADLEQILLDFIEFQHPYHEPRGSIIDRFIKNIKPKTEWNVELVDGKLKLKN